jgi:hypothetical protein
MGTGETILEDNLNSLTLLYSADEEAFLMAYRSLSLELLSNIRSAEFLKEKTELQEYLAEVHFYYRSAVRKNYEENGKCLKAFTLRNFDDLQEMIYFLDKMIYLYNTSPGHFMELFPQCPEAYWDKIDDLRETSFKYQRDSADFIECLEKCKKVSFLYSEYMDYLSNNIEEWN